MHKLLRFILKVRRFRKRWTQSVIWLSWRSSRLPWGEWDSSFRTSGSCRMGPLPTLRETPDSGWRNPLVTGSSASRQTSRGRHIPQTWTLVTFFSGVIWRIGSTVNHQQLYWNWRTQSSIMWINWETMLSSRDVWLGNSRRGLECAWTGRAATLSTCSDVLMTHPHSAESNVLLIVLLQSILPNFHKTRLMVKHVCWADPWW